MKYQTTQLQAPVAAVTMKSRPKVAVVCPHCWTVQRSERDICYQCGAQFFYLDELHAAEDDVARGA